MRIQLTTYKLQLGLLLFVGCWSLAPFQAQAYVFTRDLKLGDVGEDVRVLQVTLNSDPRTRIAESGPGSVGNETLFFGGMTHSAVIRYQNLHAKEILEPNGLLVGTGYVGSVTRQQLSGTESASVKGETTIDGSISAFDAALGLSKAETNRSAVETPIIPSTEQELIEAMNRFAGPDATEEEIKDFSTNMVLIRYGYASDISKNSTGADDAKEDAQAGTKDQNKDSGETGAGCMALLFDLLGL